MKTTRLIIVAVGGQGNLLASRILGEASLISEIPVRMSEIHGMAQRGGVVESAIVFGNAESTIISDGEADVLVGFEPSETLRALNKCNPDTTVITSLSPLPPFTVAIGRGVYPELGALQRSHPRKDKKTYSFRCHRSRKRGRKCIVRKHGFTGSAPSNRYSPPFSRKREGGNKNKNRKICRIKY